MKPKELLNEIFEQKIVANEQGNKFPLSSNIDRNEGEFLSRIIRENKPQKTIEIGCAHGISSLYICSELQSIENAHHTIIDPFQTTDWKSIGISNLKKAGINFFEHIEKPSEIALPQLLSEEKKFDFGFIDGWHTFDHTLIDFFYLNRLISIGGVIVIDDVTMPAINKLMRYIINYPAYELIGFVEVNQSRKRRIFESVIFSPFKFSSLFFPEKYKYKIFASSIIKSDKKLSLNASMIALKKVKPDERRWNWYKEF